MGSYGGLAVRGLGIAAGSAVGPPATCAGLLKFTQDSNSDKRNVYCSGIIIKYAHQRFMDDVCEPFSMWAYEGLAVRRFGIAAGSAVGPPATCAGLDERTQCSNTDKGNVYCPEIIIKYVH
jgi:hypothetical protein